MVARFQMPSGEVSVLANRQSRSGTAASTSGASRKRWFFHTSSSSSSDASKAPSALSSQAPLTGENSRLGVRLRRLSSARARMSDWLRPAAAKSERGRYENPSRCSAYTTTSSSLYSSTQKASSDPSTGGLASRAYW